MDIKELNASIPAELKIKLKEFIKKFDNTLPPSPAPAPPTTPDPAPTPPAAFAEGTLEDGTTVIKSNTPSFAEGSIITVVTPEGEVSAPEGDLKLQDGTVLTIQVKEGVSVVTAIKAPEAAPTAPAPMAPEIQQAVQQVAGFAEQMKAFASEKKELSEKIAAQDIQIKEMKARQAEFVQLFAQVLEIPSADPINTPQNKKPRPRVLSLAD